MTVNEKDWTPSSMSSLVLAREMLAELSSLLDAKKSIDRTTPLQQSCSQSSVTLSDKQV